MGDTGLLVTQIFRDSAEPIEESVYKEIIFNKLGINMGMIIENIVAQMLRADGYEPFFHAFGRYEVDFIIPDGKKLNALEIKSSAYKSHSSLDKFAVKFSDRIKNQYVVYSKDFKKEGNVTYLPFYMVMCL